MDEGFHVLSGEASAYGCVSSLKLLLLWALGYNGYLLAAWPM